MTQQEAKARFSRRLAQVEAEGQRLMQANMSIVEIVAAEVVEFLNKNRGRGGGEDPENLET